MTNMRTLSNEHLEIGRVAQVTPLGEKVPFGPHGHVITQDGTVYTLYYRWYHGIICAILFPDVAKNAGYEPPITPHDDNNVFEYQRFELNNSAQLPVLRISMGAFGESFNISSGEFAVTKDQIEALLAVTTTHGVTGRELVQVNFGEIPLMKLVELLRSGVSICDI